MLFRSSVFNDDKLQSKLAGCDGFLAKPVSVGKLFDLLGTHLKLDWLYELPAGTRGDGSSSAC